jgi:hypothetical protein
MKMLLVAALLGGLSLTSVSAAHAQTGPAFPMPGKGTSEEGARRTSSAVNAQELARNQRRAAMTPEELKRDQQMELLEARTGNTSFGGNGGPERQFDSGRSGNGFMVKKYKAKAGFLENKRGQTHYMGGSNPPGKPLVHKHKSKNKFLLF